MTARVMRTTALVVFWVLALWLQPATVSAEETIKIATQSPLSGAQVPLGEAIKLGAQLAIEKLKGPLVRMGYRVELVPFDDQDRPDIGVANARTILGDREILAVVGHLSSRVAIPSSEVYRDATLAMVSPADTDPLVTDRGLPGVSRVCGRDDVEGAAAAEFVAGTLRARTVYVVHDRSTRGQGAAELFKADAEKRGLRVLGFEGTEERSAFDEVLAPLKARNPEVVYFGGALEQAASFFKQARERGVKARFIGSGAMDSPDLVRLAGPAVTGLYYTLAAGPASSLPRGRAFVDEFRARFGKEPALYAAQAYDAAAVALRAIEAAGRDGRAPTREQVAAEVRKVRLTGITGEIEFDARGDRRKAPYFVVQVTGDGPDRWGENRVVKQLTVGPPAPR